MERQNKLMEVAEGQRCVNQDRRGTGNGFFKQAKDGKIKKKPRWCKHVKEEVNVASQKLTQRDYFVFNTWDHFFQAHISLIESFLDLS